MHRDDCKWILEYKPFALSSLPALPSLTFFAAVSSEIIQYTKTLDNALWSTYFENACLKVESQSQIKVVLHSLYKNEKLY